MGLLDQFLRDALGADGGGARSAPPQASTLLEGVISLLAQQGGGPSGAGGGLQLLARMFEQQGLGDVLSSWIGTGQNRAISPEQLGRVFGADQISRISQRAGVSPSDGLGVLAQMLPLVVDRLTPQGQIPQRDPLEDMGQRLLSQLGGTGGGPRMAGDKPRPDFSNVTSGSSSTAPAPAKPAARTYTVVAGDSLSKISKKFYGDANQWKKIFEANRDQIKNPDLIRPGQTFQIPD
jgi:uncharacterized protein YidB (DUF937 family)